MVYFNNPTASKSYDNLNTSMFGDEECIIHPLNNEIFFVTTTQEVGDKEVTDFQMFSHGHSIHLASYEDYGDKGQGYIVDCCGGWEECRFEEWEKKVNNLLSVLSNDMFGE